MRLQIGDKVKLKDGTWEDDEGWRGAVGGKTLTITHICNDGSYRCDDFGHNFGYRSDWLELVGSVQKPIEPVTLPEELFEL